MSLDEIAGGNAMNRIRGGLLLVAVVAVYTRLGMMLWGYITYGVRPTL
jgi:hypothetical protein